ncbi:MAG: PorT family protein [Rhodothermales bacterium]|nr:PorT family protein [Rhodothermales bacterium]
MNRVLILVLVSLCASTFRPVDAQVAGFGAKLGLTSAALGGENSANTRRNDYHVGVFLPVDIRNGIQTQIELVYSRQGTKIENDLRLRYNYILLPLIGKVSVDGFYVEIGGQVGRLHAARLVGPETSVSVKDQLNSFEAGVVVGGGYFLDSKSVVFGGRYTHGLTNTLVDDPDDLRFTNRTFQVFIGYVFW